MSNKIKGLGVALITPFNEDSSVDFASLERLVNHCIDGGVNYLVVLGTTAESATLSSKEKEDVKTCIKDANNNRVPMILGVGGNDTAKIVEELKNSDLTDYEAILSVTPYYNRPSQEGLYQHYKRIAQATDKPIILYNVPSRTGVNMLPDTTLRLANEFSNIIAIKEAAPNPIQATEIIKDKPKDFIVLSGDDEFTLPMILAGGEGVISVIGMGIPEIFSKLVQLARERKVDEAYDLHYKVMNIIRLIFQEGNPTGIKCLLSLLGICKPFTRLPLVPASEKLSQLIDNELKLLKIK